MGSESRSAYHRAWRKRNREHVRAYNKALYGRIKERTLARCKRRRDALRLEAIAHYGGACACCGEARSQFLGIDHVDGGGNAHRRRVGSDFNHWLKKSGYPDGFQVLCHNCNLARSFYGYCHEEPEPQ